MFEKLRIKSDFNKNVFTIFAGNIVAQIIPFFASFALARIYSPEQFGVYAILFSIVNPLSMITSGKYELAILLPEDDVKAKNLLNLSFLLNFLFFAFSWPLAYVFAHKAAIYFSIPALEVVLKVVPFFLLFTGLFYPINYWLQRKKAFRKIAFNKIVQTSSIAILSLIFGYYALQYGLVFGYLIGWFIFALTAAVQLFLSDYNFKDFSFQQIKKLANTYKNYPLFNSFPAFLNSLTFSVPVFLISYKFSESDLGHFNLMRQLLNIPSGLIAAAFTQVFYEKIVSLKKENQLLWPYTLSVLKILSFIAVIILILILTSGPFLFKMCYGEQWEISGIYAQITVFNTLLFFIITPVMFVFPALGKIKTLSFLQILYFVAITSLFFMDFSGVKNFLITFSIVEVIIFSLQLFWIIKALKQNDKKLLQK